MAIGTDFSISSLGDIRYTGAAHGATGAGYYSVIEFHRWLQDLADDAVASGDDILDITDDTPSARSTDNIITLLGSYNIDQDASEHLYDGSIIQAGGDDIWDGVVNFGNRGIHIEILQNGALYSPTFWNTVADGETEEGLNWDDLAGISHRFMIKTRTAGSDIDGRRLIGMNREFGFTYGEFSINGTARGNNVLALTHSVDLNNSTAEATVSSWTNITNITEGYANIDVNNDGADEFFYSEWNRDVQTINDLYERMKWLSRRGETTLLYGIEGQIFRGITHEIDIDTNTGTFSDVEAISWATGTGQMFAINSTTAGTKMWMQLLTGVTPTDGDTITGGTSGATADVNVSVISRPISKPFVGASTGSALIGSYGYGIEYLDLTSADKLFDLTNTQYTPPNNVTFIVGGMVSTEDRVLVGPKGAGLEIDEQQLSGSGSHTAGGSTFTVQEAIPTDTPSSGTIRIFDTSIGTFARVTYTGWNGSDFTGCTGTPDTVDGVDVWISYIDELYDGTTSTDRFTGVYLADRELFIRVRDGGTVNGTPIKTFETSGTLTSAGGSSTAIRTSDL